MDFGVTLQTNPPASRVIELTRRAEELGFGYAWTFDSHILWQEPYVIHSQMLSATQRIMVGPFVTNPVSRDPGVKVSIPWVSDGKLDVWMAGYGPRALSLIGRKADGFILQLADPVILDWTMKHVHDAAKDAGRDPKSVKVCVAAPAYVGDDLAHQRDQCRWFGGMVGNHVADLDARYGEDSEVPHALTDYIRARQGYDYSHHGQAGNPSTDFVPNDIVDRFCVLGPVEDHVKRLNELRDLGADQFNVYLMHDAMEETLGAYGEEIIPALGSKAFR